MCIVANETHLSNTQIFAAVCGSDGKVPKRQLVVYQNQAHAPANANGDNFMCLPVPLKDGLVPKEHIALYNFSGEGKPAKLKQMYDNFFENLNAQYERPPVSRSLNSKSESSRSAPGYLEVVQVGGYKCSLARTPDDVLNLDPAVFGKPVGLNAVLQANYPHNYGFLLCAFKQAKNEKKEFHPLLYTHPIAEDGKLFIPTRHYHGKGDPTSKTADDWDHRIFVMGARTADVEQVTGSKPMLGGKNAKVWKATKPTAVMEHVHQAIMDAFHGNPNDGLNVRQTFGENAFKIEVKGRFDNIDFQPAAILNVA